MLGVTEWYVEMCEKNMFSYAFVVSCNKILTCILLMLGWSVHCWRQGTNFSYFFLKCSVEHISVLIFSILCVGHKRTHVTSSGFTLGIYASVRLKTSSLAV
jgi:hypothetical protein